MKKYLAVFSVIGSLTIAAQSYAQPGYQKDPHLPVFSLQQMDNSVLHSAQLPVYDHTTIIYFSPDCDHCRTVAKDIAGHNDSFKNMFFLWVSFSPVADIKKFGQLYGLNNMPNMRLVRDADFFLLSFYEVKNTPFTAVYDKNRKLEATFPASGKTMVSAGKLLALINKKS